MKSDDEWVNLVKGILRAEMARRGMTYEQLSQRLAELGIQDTAVNIRNKVARGGFSAVFFVTQGADSERGIVPAAAIVVSVNGAERPPGRGGTHLARATGRPVDEIADDMRRGRDPDAGEAQSYGLIDTISDATR